MTDEKNATQAPAEGPPNPLFDPDKDDPSEILSPGTIIGEHRIERLIGKGGMGYVYRATHTKLGARTALKVMRRRMLSEPLMAERFLREAQLVNQIRHPTMIAIFGFGKLEDGRSYYVMELLEGKTLWAVLAERKVLPWQEALSILRPVAQGLDALHAIGVIHRDIKPDNLYLLLDPSASRSPPNVKILDFGLAKQLRTLEVTGAPLETQGPVLFGAGPYIPPEKMHSEVVTPAYDIFSFGVVAYQLLVGIFPWRGSSYEELMAQRQYRGGRPIPPSSVKPELSTWIDGVFINALDEDPKGRYATAGEFIDALEKAATMAAPTFALSSFPIQRQDPSSHAEDDRRTTDPEAVALDVQPDVSASSSFEEPVETALPSNPRAQSEAAMSRPARSTPPPPPPSSKRAPRILIDDIQSAPMPMVSKAHRTAVPLESVRSSDWLAQAASSIRSFFPVRRPSSVSRRIGVAFVLLLFVAGGVVVFRLRARPNEQAVRVTPTPPAPTSQQEGPQKSPAMASSPVLKVHGLSPSVDTKTPKPPLHAVNSETRPNIEHRRGPHPATAPKKPPRASGIAEF